VVSLHCAAAKLRHLQSVCVVQPVKVCMYSVAAHATASLQAMECIVNIMVNPIKCSS